MDTQNTYQAILNTLHASNRACDALKTAHENENFLEIDAQRSEISRLMQLASALERDLLAKLHAGETCPAFTAAECQFLEREGFNDVSEALLFFGQP